MITELVKHHRCEALFYARGNYVVRKTRHVNKQNIQVCRIFFSL